MCSKTIATCQRAAAEELCVPRAASAQRSSASAGLCREQPRKKVLWVLQNHRQPVALFCVLPAESMRSCTYYRAIFVGHDMFIMENLNPPASLFSIA